MNDLFTTTDNPISKITRPYVHLHVIKEEIPSSFPHTHSSFKCCIIFASYYCTLMVFKILVYSIAISIEKDLLSDQILLPFPPTTNLSFSLFFPHFLKYYGHTSYIYFFLKNQSVFIIITISFLEDVVSLCFI